LQRWRDRLRAASTPALQERAGNLFDGRLHTTGPPQRHKIAKIVVLRRYRAFFEFSHGLGRNPKGSGRAKYFRSAPRLGITRQ
jgi:hypothetical protein